MKCGYDLLLLGILVSVGDGAFPPGSCDGYTNISQAWRHATYFSQYFVDNEPQDDSFMVGQWWRFVGPSGGELITDCKESPTGSLDNVQVLNDDIPRTQISTLAQVRTYVKCELTFRHIIETVQCPGGFYVYKPLGHTANAGYITWHSQCEPDCCGPDAECFVYGDFGLCRCLPGYAKEEDTRPPDDRLCLDIDECEDETVCGMGGNCTNVKGSYNCTCFSGYEPEFPSDPGSPCHDIDECLDPLECENGDCENLDGNHTCHCNSGFYFELDISCNDIDECLSDEKACGPNSVCNNTIGGYGCVCEVGYREDSLTEDCVDINECTENITLCGSNGNCINEQGSFICECFPGYRLDPGLDPYLYVPCPDIDECSENPDICIPKSFCVNKPGTYTCACSDRYFPSTGIIWSQDTVCESIEVFLNKPHKFEKLSKEDAFFAKMDQQLKENEGKPLHDVSVGNAFSAAMEVAGVGPYIDPPKVSSAGDGETGSVILDLAEGLVAALLVDIEEQTTIALKTPTLDLDVVFFGPNDVKPSGFSLAADGVTVAINLEQVASNNNGSAAVSFMKLKGLESLLSHRFFETENLTDFGSDIFSASLPTMSNTNLTEPVNFTVLHTKTLAESGLMTCTYWVSDKLIDIVDGEESSVYGPGHWSDEGCWSSSANENYTICSCSHLSTFSLIMQIGEPPPESDFLDWLNRICVSIGLFFFALAILTFLLCSWNPRINNTARLHLCINLGLSHLLLLFNESFFVNKLACKGIAGILHFLVVSSFVWMLLEAVQLYMLVRRLNKVQVIERDGLPQYVLYPVGYGVPLVVVGVSALVYHPGYGGTEGGACWLTTTRGFNWALTGPVITILALNFVLFCATLWSLRTTLANMRKGASNSRDAKLVLFKIVAQFVILGCTWILGLLQINLFFQILFIVLNSQQGTFLYVVHCLLNREIQQECLKCLSCCKDKKEEDKTDGEWTTEDQNTSR